jgi:hypothetical protein
MPAPTIPTVESLRDRPDGWSVRQHADVVRQAHSDHLDAAQRITDDAEFAGRDLLASEQRSFDRHMDEVRRAEVLLRRIEDSPEGRAVDRSGMPDMSRNGGDHPAVTGTFREGQPLGERRMADYVAARGLVRDGEEDLSLRK